MKHTDVDVNSLHYVQAGNRLEFHMHGLFHPSHMHGLVPAVMNTSAKPTLYQNIVVNLDTSASKTQSAMNFFQRERERERERPAQTLAMVLHTDPIVL